MTFPLQGHFLGTMEAGDTLCDRMRDVLYAPASESAVLTCFQRVMMLGFLGSYRSLNDPERQKLVKALSEHVAPFTYPQTHPVLAESRSGRGVGSWFSSWPVRIAVSVIVVAALWWGLNNWLDQMLATLLPGAVK
ncbi:DotU family type IV/VI secretion system protein [Raoultella ornithinolytica]|nr:DotU family type IV/VI secretion system protein [Raoultella ornithinolytica]